MKILILMIYFFINLDKQVRSALSYANKLYERKNNLHNLLFEIRNEKMKIL